MFGNPANLSSRDWCCAPVAAKCRVLLCALFWLPAIAHWVPKVRVVGSNIVVRSMREPLEQRVLVVFQTLASRDRAAL